MASQRDTAGRSRPNETQAAAAAAVVNDDPLFVGDAVDEEEEEYWSCKDRLTWRMDPDESLSDHTINIVLIEPDDGVTNTTNTKSDVDEDDDNEDTQEEKTAKIHSTYHVHRAVLAFGPKRSAYFARLFQGRHFSEAVETRTSEIRLLPAAADAFGIFLDYLYAPRDELPLLSPANVTALHFLAQYFEVARLRRRARQFWQRDLGLQDSHNHSHHHSPADDDRLGRYYGEAKLFCDVELQQAVIDKVTEEIVTRSRSSSNNAAATANGNDDYAMVGNNSLCPHLLQVSDDELWLELLKRNGGHPNRRLENLVAEYCCMHCQQQDEDSSLMQQEAFLQLTHPDYLPHFASVEAALGLMEAGCSLFPDNSADAQLLSSLEDRFVEKLSTDWEYFLAIGVPLPTNLHASTYAQLYQRSLARAATEKQALLERLVQTERALPCSIVVADAGLANVNGVYHRSPTEFRNGAPVFVKSGSFFRLDVCLENSNYWSISKFYSRRHEAGSMRLPPQTGWQRSFLARNGANQSLPTLQYVYPDAAATGLHGELRHNSYLVGRGGASNNNAGALGNFNVNSGSSNSSMKGCIQ